MSVDADNPATPIKAQVEDGYVTIDVVDLEYADAVRLCDEGLLEVIDPSILPAGADGTPAMDDFLPGHVTDCTVATIVFSTVFAYDTTKFAKGPTTMADFFDMEKFPGKRGMRKGTKANLEMALMGDGVPAAEVYPMLETPEGIDRAFSVLDRIKADTTGWEAGAQPSQLLADGEVAMTTAYNDRIFAAAVFVGKPFNTVWNGQIMEYDLFAIPKGAPGMENTKKFIALRPAPSSWPIRPSGSLMAPPANLRVRWLACIKTARPKWRRSFQRRWPIWSTRCPQTTSSGLTATPS